MLGFLVMMSGMVALATAVSYWISWDMQPQDERLSFTKTVWGDLADLIAKWRMGAANVGSRSPAARPDRAASSRTPHSSEASARLARPAFSRS
jgi:hypothetical protein